MQSNGTRNVAVFSALSTPGIGNHRIRRCVNSPLKRKAGDFGGGEREGYRAGLGVGPGLFDDRGHDLGLLLGRGDDENDLLLLSEGDVVKPRILLAGALAVQSRAAARTGGASRVHDHIRAALVGDRDYQLVSEAERSRLLLVSVVLIEI